MGPALLGKDVVAESEDILLKGVHKLECDFHFDLVYTALKIYRLVDRFFSVVQFTDISDDPVRLMVSYAFLFARTFIYIVKDQLRV